jgi:hypothetical protein
MARRYAKKELETILKVAVVAEVRYTPVNYEHLKSG